MRLIIIITLSCWPLNLTAQDMIVAESIKAFYPSGQKVRTHDIIGPGTKVKIERKGKLSINYRHRWTLYFEKGTHSIDSAILFELKKPEYKLNDSIYSILEAKGIQNCKFNYKRETPAGSYHSVIVDNIKITKEPDFLTKSNFVNLNWTDPIKYSGVYYVVLMDFFETYIGIEQAKENNLKLDLRPFRSRKVIKYKIIAEDCRESYIQTLRFE